MSSLVPGLSLQIVALQKALDVSQDKEKELMKEYEKLSALCTRQGIRLMEQEDELKDKEDAIKELKKEIARLQDGWKSAYKALEQTEGWNG